MIPYKRIEISKEMLEEFNDDSFEIKQLALIVGEDVEMDSDDIRKALPEMVDMIYRNRNKPSCPPVTGMKKTKLI